MGALLVAPAMAVRACCRSAARQASGGRNPARAVAAPEQASTAPVVPQPAEGSAPAPDPTPNASAAPAAVPWPAAPRHPDQPPLPQPVRALPAGTTLPSVRSVGGVLPLAAPGDTARYQNIATDTVLDLARQLAEQQASPAALLQALTGLGLPVQPLSDQVCGASSVAGNSIKGWNEDTALAFHSQHPLLGPLDVLMAFDGMGGLRDGKLASKFAALAMAIELHRLPDTLTTDPTRHLAAAFERVNRRFRKAGAALYGQVDANALRSTAIVLVADAQRYLVAHQGDGHAQLRRADGTRLPLMQAHKGAVCNAVTHSLGPVPDGEASLAVLPRQPGDLVFIASDGFDPVPADQLLDALHAYSQQHPLQQVVAGITDDCCQQSDAHGPIADDNMTLVALRTPAADSAPAPAHNAATATT